MTRILSLGSLRHFGIAIDLLASGARPAAVAWLVADSLEWRGA